MSTTPVRTPGPPPVHTSRPLSGGRLAAVIVGCLLVLLGLGAVLGGAAIAAATSSRDGDGFLTTGPGSVSTGSYAVTVPDIGLDVRGPDAAYAGDLLGTIRIRATGQDANTPLFVGVAPTADAAAYLSGVGYAAVTDVEVDPVRVSYADHAGGAPVAPPGDRAIWVASDSGTGTRTVEWELAAGDWTVVVMNADGSAGVRADVDLGGELPVLRWTTVGLFVGGGLLLLGGALMIVLPLATRRRGRPGAVPFG